MAVCRRCGNQMADNAAACPACGELRYQPPQAPQQQYPAAATPQQQQPQYPQYAQPQPQAYGAPQPAQAYAMPVSADEAKGFIGALFDLSFTNFITTKIIKFMYIVAIVVCALYALAMVGAAFSSNSMLGLGALIVSPLLFLLFVVLARIYMELVIVIFRGAEHLAEIAKQTKR